MDREYLDPVFIRARNLPEAWFLLLKRLFEIDAYAYYPEWGGGADENGKCDNIRREFDMVTCQITHPGERPLCDITPPGLAIPAPSTTHGKIEEYFNTYILCPFVGENESYTYGSRICEQVDYLIGFYREYGFDHGKCCMEIGDPSDLKRGKSLPCLRLIDTKIRMDRVTGVYRLHFYVYFRAWDLWGGFPQNLGGLQLFKEWLVDQIGPHPKTGVPLEDGEMIVMSKSLNVRGHMFAYAKERVGLRATS